MKTPEERCLELILHLDDQMKGQLREFADSHLAKRGLWATTGRDLVQDALLAILCGFQTGPHGRHPRAEDLADSSAFANYLRGVLWSLIEAETRKRRHWPAHEPLSAENNDGEDRELWLDLNAANPADETSFADLKNEFFRRLRARCPGYLMPLAARWESVFPGDGIPLNGAHRRHRAKLLGLARKTLQEMGIALR
jgi:hypothetical protein